MHNLRLSLTIKQTGYPDIKIKKAHPAFSKQIKCGKYFFVNTEAKMTASVVNAPIVSGYARIHTIVFHWILGPGFKWCVRDVPK